MTNTTRGKFKVLIGFTYRAGDGWKRAEPGEVVSDLGDVDAADFKMLVDAGAIEPAGRGRKAKAEDVE